MARASPRKKVRNMTTKDTPGTLPIYLYAADSPTVQPLKDFTVLSEAVAIPVPHRETTETLYKLSQIVVCVKADSNESHPNPSFSSYRPALVKSETQMTKLEDPRTLL